MKSTYLFSHIVYPLVISEENIEIPHSQSVLVKIKHLDVEVVSVLSLCMDKYRILVLEYKKDCKKEHCDILVICKVG